MTTITEAEQTSSSSTMPGNDPLNVAGRVGGVIILLIIAVGVIGNILVLTAIIRCRQLQRSYNAFIASLSVTDLIFNVVVMPFYVDTYVHRRWRFSDAICRWHTFFGTIVIVSSSLHIALIAASRYHVIVRPRFYARWLSSGVAIVSQILFAWVAAAAMVIPGAVGAIPTVIGYSDQLSRCNYDRAESYGALSLVFCGGFIVPCVVMGYCYGMIWRRTRQVRQRINGYGAFRLMKMQRHQQNGESVAGDNDPSPTAVVPQPNNDVCDYDEQPAKPQLLKPQRTIEDVNDTNIVVHKAKIVEQFTDGNEHSGCATDCWQGNAVDFGVQLLPTARDALADVSSNTPENSQTVATEHSSPTATGSYNTATASSWNDDDNADDRKPADSYQSRRAVGSVGQHQRTMPVDLLDSPKPEHLLSVSDVTNDQVTDVAASAAVQETNKLGRPSTVTQTLPHDSITVIVTPATSPISTATCRRQESLTEVVAAQKGAKSPKTATCSKRRQKSEDGHPSNWPTVRSCSAVTLDRASSLVSPLRRCRSAGRDMDDRSPVPSPPSSRHRSHSLRMILAVFFAFVLTYLPFTVTNLADQHARLDRNVYMMTSLAFWAGSCVNPLIYGIMNVQFRRAYVSIIVSCCRRSVSQCHAH